MALRQWMATNLATQGYCLSDRERRELWLGLRFSTGLCLALVVAGLALQSPTLIFVLCGVGAIAGLTARHPFDYLWNLGARHLFKAPVLPPNPIPRRHAFKFATTWLLIVGVLLAVGATTPALILGGLLVAGCATVTTTNLCLPSQALAWWQRRGIHKEAITA
jgi:hypothetical protein